MACLLLMTLPVRGVGRDDGAPRCAACPVRESACAADAAVAAARLPAADAVRAALVCGIGAPGSTAVAAPTGACTRLIVLRGAGGRVETDCADLRLTDGALVMAMTKNLFRR